MARSVRSELPGLDRHLPVYSPTAIMCTIILTLKLCLLRVSALSWEGRHKDVKQELMKSAALLTWHAGRQVCKAHVREEPNAALRHGKDSLLGHHSDIPVR